MPYFEESEGFKLKSGNKSPLEFKQMGSSPVKKETDPQVGKKMQWLTWERGPHGQANLDAQRAFLELPEKEQDPNIIYGGELPEVKVSGGDAPKAHAESKSLKTLPQRLKEKKERQKVFRK